jgi:hypothetical protein
MVRFSIGSIRLSSPAAISGCFHSHGANSAWFHSHGANSAWFHADAATSVHFHYDGTSSRRYTPWRRIPHRRVMTAA